MKLLVVLLVAFGIGGFVLSWVATAYSRERKSISRHIETMDVIHRIANEATPSGVLHTQVEPRPHIRVVGGRQHDELQKEQDKVSSVHSESAIQDDTSVNEPTTVSKFIDAAHVASVLEFNSKIAKDASHTPKKENVKVTIDELAGVIGTTDAVFSELAADHLAGENLPKVSSREPKVRRFGSKRHIERVASPVLAGSAAAVVLVLVVGYFAVTRGNGAPLISRPASTATTIAKKDSSRVSPTKTTQPSFIAPFQTNTAGSSIAVPLGSYTVKLTVAASCWVAQSATNGGTISWDAVLLSGQSRVITTSGPLWIRTGNSTVVSLWINGIPVHFTSAPGPFNFSFVPQASSAA